LLDADERSAYGTRLRTTLRLLERVAFAEDTGMRFQLDTPELAGAGSELEAVVVALDRHLAEEREHLGGHSPESPRRARSRTLPIRARSRCCSFSRCSGCVSTADRSCVETGSRRERSFLPLPRHSKDSVDSVACAYARSWSTSFARRAPLLSLSRLPDRR